MAAEKQNIYEQMYGEDDKSMAFNGPASAHNDRGIEVPFFRYVPWELLDPDRQTLAGAAGYDEKTWNAIGTHNLTCRLILTYGIPMQLYLQFPRSRVFSGS